MGRPATGRTPVKSFRPPQALWARLQQLAANQGRKTSDALIEAVHDWVTKHERAVRRE